MVLFPRRPSYITHSHGYMVTWPCGPFSAAVHTLVIGSLPLVAIIGNLSCHPTILLQQAWKGWVLRSPSASSESLEAFTLLSLLRRLWLVLQSTASWTLGLFSHTWMPH